MTDTAGRRTAVHTAASSSTPAGSESGQHQQATQQATDANSSHLHFHIADMAIEVTLPPLDKLAFYAGLGAAVAFGVIEWPIAALTGLGHLLTDDRRNRTLRALGEALDAAA
jgi:hypothetical protein